MPGNALQNIEQTEASLWEAADQLRANSKLTSSEYAMPVLGVIFLHHAANRYYAAKAAIEAEQAAGKMPQRPLVKADFVKRRAMLLPKQAQFDELMRRPNGADLGRALGEAMNAIEAEFEPLAGQFPKEYDGFDPALLEDLLRIFYRGEDTSHRASFFGQEKTATTIRLAKMNLAVHGLEGDIREANSFYEDVHELYGRCDFVMTNPPFNVDMVDAEKIKDDCRLPFGLPGVKKQKKVGNGNYLWVSYFWSYLNDQGCAGFVISSQASSAGHGEMAVRRKLVETGDVDVMIAIRANFFYTRTVPCELWHLDRGKPDERRDQVLMIDARNTYRKVTRKIYDFSPEQLKLAVYFHRRIHWLQDRFPAAEFAAVPGLCKAVNRAEIEAADWSLTPGRYVGVAPPEEEEGFDFEQTMGDIHVELADLNREAVELAARIQENVEGLM